LLKNVLSQVVVPKLHKLQYFQAGLSKTPLPCRMGSSDRVEMSFVDYLPKQSDILTQVCDQIAKAKDISDLNVLVLLGGSGAGKTRTAYDVAKRFYTFYFEVSCSSARDLVAMLDTVKLARPKFQSVSDVSHIRDLQDAFEDRCRSCILQLLLARMITLFYLGTGQVTRPVDWLYAQLDSVYDTSKQVFSLLGHCRISTLASYWAVFPKLTKFFLSRIISLFSLTSRTCFMQSYTRFAGQATSQ